jgi:cold shock CspA family protein
VVRLDSGDRDVWVHLLNVEGLGQRTSLNEGERVRVEYRHIEHGPSGRWHGERVMLLSPNWE